MVMPHLVCGHEFRLGTWLPILQGIADKSFPDISHVLYGQSCSDWQVATDTGRIIAPGAGGFMLAEFSIVPVGVGSSIGDQLAEVLKIVDASGLPYKLNPMGTVVEGEWDDLIGLIKRCHEAVMSKGERAVTTISIDDRKGKPNRIEQKVESIEKRIGKTLKK